VRACSRMRRAGNRPRSAAEEVAGAPADHLPYRLAPGAFMARDDRYKRHQYVGFLC
jgi:hypothetical protein